MLDQFTRFFQSEHKNLVLWILGLAVVRPNRIKRLPVILKLVDGADELGNVEVDLEN